MSRTRALFAGPGAVRALVDGRGGVVELVVGGGAYVRLGSEWLFVAEPDTPFGPLSVAVSGLDSVGLYPGAPAHVGRGRLALDGRAVSLERMRERGAAAVGPAPAAAAFRAVRHAAAVAEDGLPTPPATLHPGLAALRAARGNDAVRLLAGLGEGLTPAGDDVLSGYAAMRLALGAPVALSPAAAGRSSALGLAYLRCAERGELPDTAARLLDAIHRGSVAATRAALPALREWGASSGSALAWGMTGALAHSIERSW